MQTKKRGAQAPLITVGTGKTHLATGLGIRACQAGHRVAFATAAQWVARLADAHQVGRLSDELTRLGRIPLIVVDEVGYIPFEPEAANLFFQFISGRYERASVIVTSNKPFGKAHMFRRTCARQRLNSTGSNWRGGPSSWTYPSCRDGDIRAGRHPGEDAGRLLATQRQGGQRPWGLLRQEPRRLR